MSIPSRVIRPATLLPFAGAAAAFTILSGPIQAQIVPAQVTTRAWDASTATAGTFNWGDPVNWATDTLPGINDIAAFPAPATVINVDLGATTREVGSLYLGTAAGAANWNFQNGTLLTSSINQNVDDPNALTPTALVMTKNGGLDVLNVSVSSNTLQLQGQVTAGGLNKFGGTVLRLGTSGTAFDNAINGNIAIYGGTLQASAGSTAGVNNPLGGTGNVTIANSGVTLSLTHSNLAAAGAAGTYDFVRDIVANNNSFTLNADRAAGLATSGTSQVGTLTMGNATLTTTIGNGFNHLLDALSIVTGATGTRVQANSVTRIDGISGDASSNFYKRGGSDVEIRGNNESSFSGGLHIKEATLRLLSANGTDNPAGGSDSTIFFGNGYGINALDGGQLLQLRSDASLDFGSSLALSPGVTIARLDVNRVGTAATNQTLRLGDANMSGGLLTITGGNGFLTEFDSITVGANTTGIVNPTSSNTRVTALNVGPGGTLIKTGGSQLVLLGDNTATMLGTLILRAGELQATVAGSLGSKVVTIGGTAVNTAGILTDTGILRWNAVGASGNATGEDVLVNAASQVDLNVNPGAGDVFHLAPGGIIQGNNTQFAALTVGANLLADEDAILGHETHAAVSQINGLANDAKLFYGLSANANAVLPAIGVGTPWKGLSNDRTARSILQAGTPATVTVNGGDNDASTIEAVFQGVNGTTLSFGSNTLADSYTFASATGQKVTLAIRGIGGTSISVTPGGNVAFEDDAASTGLAANVDKIYVQSGTLLLGTNNGLGGVPVDVLNGGGIDVRTTAAFDGVVTIKSGGVLFLNDNFQLTGTGGPITIEGGGKLDITGTTPANILTSSQPINFTGTGHTVRFAASEITNLDSTVPDVGVTYVVAGGATAAVLGSSILSVTTNTQTAGITIDGGTLTNDATSRGFSGPINLNNSNFTIAATRNTSLGITGSITTAGNVQVGSNTAIDFRDKNQNPDRVSALGLPDPYNGHSQVLLLGSVTVGGNITVANGTRLGFGDPATNIAGDLIFNGTALYLDGGGDLANANKGGLTARLTDTTGLVANRVANTIVLGNYARSELSVTGAGPMTITQPFVITGQVNPIDKRTFWVDRADAAGTPAVLFSDILLKAGSQFGIDENNTAVRVSLKLDGNSTLVRNHDDYDIRNLTKGPNAPANVTLFAGEPNFGWDDATEYLVNGSNAAIISTVDGTIEAGITVDLIRGQLFFEKGSTLNGIVRAQTAPARGDAFVVFRDTTGTTATPFTHTGAGEVQVGRSVAAAGPEDFEMRGAEVTAGASATLTVAVPVRVVNDGINNNVDGVIRSNRQNDSTILASTVLTTLNIDPGARAQLNSQLQVPLTVSTINVGAGGSIENTNNNSVLVGTINAGTNAIGIVGSAQTRVTGNITAGQINVSGAGIEFDAGAGNTSTANAPMLLNGRLSVRTGNANLGTNVITGAATQLVAGLRENKTLGAFDETTANFSNEIALGTTYAQLPTLSWGENQTVTYTGQIFIPDNGTLGDGVGSVAFAKWFDDSVRVVIDGNTGSPLLRSTAFNDGVANASGNLAVGWHDIEIRLGQGTGGAGPVAQDGNAFNLGLGIDITGTVSTQTGGGVGLVIDGGQYVAPVDDGLMSLFRTTTVKSSISLAANTNLSAGGFTNIGSVIVSGANAAILLSGGGASDADSLTFTGAFNGTLNLSQSAATTTINSSTVVPSGGTLTKTGNGSLVLNVASDVDGTFRVSAGSVTLNANGAGGTGTIDVDAGSFTVGSTGTHGGAATLDGGALVVNGTIMGNVTLTAGTLRGSGTIGGTLNATAGGNIAPGNGGVLTVGSLAADASTTFTFELARGGSAPVAGIDYDQLATAGAIDLGGLGGDANGAILTLAISAAPQIGDVFTIILNTGADADTGTFAGFANAALIDVSGYQFQISYFDDASTAGFETAGGNDVSLLVTVPEPGSLSALAAASAVAMGLRRFRRRTA